LYAREVILAGGRPLTQPGGDWPDRRWLPLQKKSFRIAAALAEITRDSVTNLS
jgi:hypothetical protein